MRDTFFRFLRWVNFLGLVYLSCLEAKQPIGLGIWLPLAAALSGIGLLLDELSRCKRWKGVV